MVRVVDTVRIKASVDSVAEWLRDMPHHYWEWHRDHVAFRVLAGPERLGEGSVAYAEERLGGFRLAFTFKITHEEPKSFLAWRATFPHSLIRLRGSFTLKRIDTATTELTAITSYGWPVPVAGPAFDWVMNRFFVSRELVAEHMREEGMRVKNSLEGPAKQRT